jgi:hypothetical protein
MRNFIYFTGLAATLAAGTVIAAAPVKGAGFPSRDPDLDIAKGFVAPPAGYGEVPFWWWTGEKLDKERLLWQLEELHKAGVSGTQINYAHTRSNGWKTETVEPAIFSEAWWDIFAFMAKESAKRDMGIGLSGYTLDWPGRDNLYRQLGITDESLSAHALSLRQQDVTGAARVATAPQAAGAAVVSITAFALKGGRLVPGSGLALDPKEPTWTLPPGQWRLLTVSAETRPDTLDPLNPDSGLRVIDKFLSPFLAHTPPDAQRALNYFFQDELRLAGDGRLWSPEFAAQFEKRKGYDVLPKLAALFMDIGPETAKIRLDFNDVMVSLTEAYYFKPIFDWHNSRGMIYACDPASRGKNPLEFGDYFRAMRWYTAPGFDTPGSSSDPIKNKVGSSIAHLYQRPRVWVEGFHSLGWQASTETIFDASNRNFLYGASLLNLHGLYYTTKGGWWEWAPPCYHFHMPYWAHMPVFLKYFERLSYLLSQGAHVADVAVVYPHEPLVADHARGEVSRDLAFALGTDLLSSGQADFDFIDADSFDRADVQKGRLTVSGESYRLLVMPGLFAARFATLEKALAFYRAGGAVVALGDLPEATDRAGAGDPRVDAITKELFGLTASEAKAGKKAFRQTHASGGVALLWAEEPALAAVPARTYAGHFTGRWVWTQKPARKAAFKSVWEGESADYQAALLCDNHAAFYLNGALVATWDSYSKPWTGTVSLKKGDVLVVEGSDSDGESGDKTAGIFFALARNAKTVFSAEGFRVKPGGADAAWRTTAAVDGLEKPDSDNVHAAHKGAVAAAPKTSAVQGIRSLLATPDFSGPEGSKALHRRIGKNDVYFIMDLKQRGDCTFRAQGTPELWDPWSGQQVLISTFTVNTNHTTTVRLDGTGAPLLVVFTPEKPARSVVESDLDRVTALTNNQVLGFARTAGPKHAVVEKDGKRVTLTGVAGAPAAPLALDGEWSFALKPTCYNKWGDYRLPGFDGFIGAEARQLTWSAPNMPKRMTYSHGPQFLAFGPLAPGAEADALEQALAKAGVAASERTVKVGPKEYAWQPFCFSWREGVENRPCFQNWHHGLNGKMGNEFFVLGKYDKGLYDVSMPASAAPEARLYQTSVYAESPCQANVVVSGVKPAAVWVNGEKRAPGVAVPLHAGCNLLLVRYDAFGRGAVVLEKADADTSWKQSHPLAMRWHDNPAVLPFDCFSGALKQSLYAFGAPPALLTAEVTLRGELLAATVGGVAAAAKLDKTFANGNRLYRVSASTMTPGPVEVTLTVKHAPGYTGGAAFPEPVKLLCGQGKIALGDWAHVDALRCYSGGACYGKAFALTPEQAGQRCVLDLGDVGVSCGVAVNANPVRVLTCPPWTLDITEQVKTGANTIDVTVYNTLNNHYQTIPTRYKKENAPSGLLGPVTLSFEAKVTLK